MELALSFVLVAVAFVIVVKGADFFVAGAGSIAQKLGVSPFVVGLTIVAIGTSAPEFFVNVIAAWQGATDLSIGNVIGSNIMNILLALGVAATIAPLAIKEQTVWKEIPFSLMGAFVILFIGADTLFGSATTNVITRGDGLVLLSFFVIFMVYTFGLAKVTNGEDHAEEQMYSWSMSVLYTVGGILGLVIGGRMVVTNAVTIAEVLGMSQNLIGLTIVAIGTSLPEIVTSVVAVRRGAVDLVVGGVVGSVIFNVFFVLGSTAVVRELPFSGDNLIDLFVLIAASILFFFVMFVGRKHTLFRWEGMLFISLYAIYITYAIIRG